MEHLSFDWLTAGLSALITGFAGWLFARRKNNAEAAMSEVAVVERVAEIWRTNTERLREEWDRDKNRCMDRIQKLEQETAERALKIERETSEERAKLFDRIRNLEHELHQLQRENIELKARLRTLSQSRGRQSSQSDT